MQAGQEDGGDDDEVEDVPAVPEELSWGAAVRQDPDGDLRYEEGPEDVLDTAISKARDSAIRWQRWATGLSRPTAVDL
ncbi:hypothetical protein [Actinoplanes derwentensis]|uniref:hypothetical protein n=1 Tax=Actinoplanes derwentensis TaxID=113562 RepID=UPI001E50FEC7|nr:hypothetical protein [Actinoplanes derwentensis]